MRRDWTVPVIVGVVVLFGMCGMGGVAAYIGLRKHPAPAAVAASASPSAAQRPQDCLIGDWLETSYAGNADIYGVRVQLSGKGTVVRYSADGVETQTLENVVVSGDAQGSHYEVVHNGSLVMHFVADATTINYSDPQPTGTTTWKVDGKQTDQEPMHATLKPDTYRCRGNELRLFSEGSASELKRIVAPGMPA